MNNKGSKVLSVYWFAILTIVAIGIVAMVMIFYGKPYDVRTIEGEVMINKIVDCLSGDDGKLRQDISNEDILQKCHFILTDEFYFEVNDFGIKQGYSNLRDSCDIREESVVCVKKSVYLLDSEGNENTIKILSAVSKWIT